MQNQEINTGIFEGALITTKIFKIQPIHLNWSLGFQQTNQRMDF